MVSQLSNLTFQFLPTSSSAPTPAQTRPPAAADPVGTASTQLKAPGVIVDLSRKARDAAILDQRVDSGAPRGVTIVSMKQIQEAIDNPRANQPNAKLITVKQLHQQTMPLREDVLARQATLRQMHQLGGQSKAPGVVAKRDSELLEANLQNMRAATQDYLKVVDELKSVLEQKRALSKYIPFGLESYLFRHDRLEDAVAQMTARGAVMIKDVDEQEARLKRMGLLGESVKQEGEVLAQAARAKD
jgi:hypothetical protein